MRVSLARGVVRSDGGRLLAGGSPFTVVRLRRAVRDTEPAASPLGRRLLASGMADPVVDGQPPVDPSDITVVVPTHDRAVDAAALHPLRVVVVDDASAVPVPGALRRDVNGGPAAARNTGLAAVTTPYVALVDSDLSVTVDDLLALSRHLADPDVVLVGPRVRGRAAGAAWWQRHDTTHSALDLGPHPAEVRPGGSVTYLPSACLLARTEALGAGFDETMRVGEDVDLVWRLHDAGHRVRYDPNVVVRHETRPTLRSWLRQVHGYGTSAAPLARRHGDVVAPAVLSPALGLAAAAVLARSRWAPVLALAAGARTAHRLRQVLPTRPAAVVAGRALGWAVRQEASLLVRHWWPAAALGALVSGRARRALAVAVVVDTAVAVHERRDGDVVSVVLGRRVTDLAYGAGVWQGAWRARSVRCLVPRRSGAGRDGQASRVRSAVSVSRRIVAARPAPRSARRASNVSNDVSTHRV